MAATIYNARHDRGAARGITPPGYGYLLIGGSIAPPTGPPFVRPDRTRQRVLDQLGEHIAELRRTDEIERATAYRAVLMPPDRPPPWRPELRAPRFDVVVLIETDSPEALTTVADAPPVTAIRDVITAEAAQTRAIQATCIRALADVDKRPDGVYLFNFWAARDRRVALQVWDHLAPWFEAKTGLRNSTVLQPVHDDDFVFVNHARWDTSLLGIAAHQFLRPTFHTFVRRNLVANDVHVYPMLYRRL